MDWGCYKTWTEGVIKHGTEGVIKHGTEGVIKHGTKGVIKHGTEENIWNERGGTSRYLNSSDITRVKKVKVPPLKATKALRVDRGIALPFLRLRHWRWGWVVSTTPWPLYPRERPYNHCTGGWVGPRVGLNGCGKSRPHRDSIPGPSSP